MGRAQVVQAEAAGICLLYTSHEDIPRVCHLMTVTAILTLLLSCGVKLPFAR